jgi:hypothetical protein
MLAPIASEITRTGRLCKLRKNVAPDVRAIERSVIPPRDCGFAPL